MRTQLEELLGQHVVLSVDMTRARLRANPDLAQTVFDAANNNSSDFENLIMRVYGQASVQSFQQVWDPHIASLFAYARAVATADTAGRDATVQALQAYPDEIGTFLEQLTHGAVMRAAVAGVEREHVGQMIAQTDAYAGGDYPRAYAIERAGYRLEFSIGKLIAAAIASSATGSVPPDFDSPVRRLQSALGELFGEHLYLASDAMVSSYAGGGDAPAAAAALDTNSQNLSQAVGALFGPAAGQRFLDIWADHIEALVGYAEAMRANDTAGKQAAQSGLTSFEREAADFLSTATEGKLSDPQLQASLVMHDQQLIDGLNAYANNDYRQARLLAFQAYQHMFELAGQFSTAVGATVAARLPVGGPQTGGGGTSDELT